MRRIVVGRGRFALPKFPKKHIKHKLNAQLSTSDNSYQFSFGIFQIYLWKVRRSPLRNFFMAFSSSS